VAKGDISKGQSPPALDAFIDYWQSREGGQERGNYQLFLIGLCEALGLPRPDAAEATRERNDYVFERSVEFKEPDGTASTGHIDLYCRSSFVLEAKQSRQPGGAKAIPDQLSLLPDSSANSDRRGRRSAARGWDVLKQRYAPYSSHSHGWASSTRRTEEQASSSVVRRNGVCQDSPASMAAHWGLGDTLCLQRATTLLALRSRIVAVLRSAGLDRMRSRLAAS
jgi:hypothetical protein